MYITKTKNSLKGLFPDFNEQIWGLKFSDIQFDNQTWRGVHIKKLFPYKGRKAIGLNIKFLTDCWRNYVTKLIIFEGEFPPYTEYMMEVPTPAMVKHLKKIKQYKDEPSRFADQGGKPMRIYFFRL